MCSQTDINSCGKKQFAQCVDYETELPEFTKITKSCVNLEDTTKDIYELIGEIKEEIPEDLIGTLETIETRLQDLEEKVLALQEENICLKDITECINIQAEDPCGELIVNLGQVLNYILNKLPNE